ncbi:ferredoxin [Rubellimicrobium sp. CFH 75288]|uniref:ferredoxin n=1 Tax=Rubellimicrobium sp. CFH 75288 TaxID=2697034 RepID=UPI0014131DAB|nr:ferredoxin [Rubellimicrobium sp. CFH 75288]
MERAADQGLPAAPPPGADPFARLAALAAPHGLRLAGIAPLEAGDGLPPRLRSAALLAPDEPGFWTRFSASPEAGDGRPDPLDRWSHRVIGRLACALGGKAAFPFGGPPWRPFIAWALRTGRIWSSPVGLLVDNTAGLWVSLRGAVLLPDPAPPPPAESPPCQGCPAPCLSACPPRALTAAGYDVPACHAFLDGPAGVPCRTDGCRVRRACPVGQGRRPAAQAAFHMRAFHP